MSNEVKFAVKEKPLLEKVSEFLLPKGFIFADPYGAPLESRHSFYNTDALGLLFKDPEIKPQEHFFGLIKKQRFQWLGTVWLDTTLRDTSAYNENLIFDVYVHEIGWRLKCKTGAIMAPVASVIDGVD